MLHPCQDLTNHFLRQAGSSGGHLGSRAKEKQHLCSLHPLSAPTGPLDGGPHSLAQLGFLFHGDLGALGPCSLPTTHVSEYQARLQGSDIKSSPGLPLCSREPETQPASSLCVRAKSLQSCPTLCNPIDCSLPGSSVHGILQARILEWVAMPSSRGSSQPRDRTHISYISCIGRQILYQCATWEAQF